MASRQYYIWTLASIFSAILLTLTPACAENTIAGIRTISSNTGVPGDTITVAVDLIITGTVFGPVLDEDIPSGWSINVIDSNGSTYQSGGINWLFADALSDTEKRVIYTVKIPSNAAQGDYHITGSVLAVVGNNTIGPYQIGGDSTITVVTDGDSSTMASEEGMRSGGITASSTVINNSESKIEEKSPTIPFILSILIVVAAVFYLKLNYNRRY